MMAMKIGLEHGMWTDLQIVDRVVAKE